MWKSDFRIKLPLLSSWRVLECLPVLSLQGLDAFKKQLLDKGDDFPTFVIRRIPHTLTHNGGYCKGRSAAGLDRCLLFRLPSPNMGLKVS